MDAETDSLVLDEKSSILDNEVSMSNLAARAAHGFSLREKRLVTAGISQIDSRRPRSGYLSLQQRTVRVHARDYAALAQVDETSAYKDLHAACENLFNRYLRYDVMTSQGRKERKIRWVGGVTYHHGEGWVEFSLTDEIMPHLSELRRQFTTYRLKQASGLRSAYSWRLLEMLTSHATNAKGAGKRTIPLEKFCKALEVPASYRFSNVRQRVIEPAVKELIDKDGWLIKWLPVKEGRKVAALAFTWQRDPQGRLDLGGPAKPGKGKPKGKKITRAEIGKQARPGESWEQAAARLRGK